MDVEFKRIALTVEDIAAAKLTRRLASIVVGSLAVLFMSLGPVQPAAGDSPTDYTLTNDGGISFADEFRRLGGVNTLGLPASHRFRLPDGFTYQLTQAALLQWRPDLNGVVLANTFEMLEQAGRDEWLYAFKGVPRPIKSDGSSGDWQKARGIRLSWLTSEAIKAAYLANPNAAEIASWDADRAIEFYGLPMSYPEKNGPFVSQRFQRIAFQLWVENVPGMPPPGTVVRVLGGDLVKEARLVPPQALNITSQPPVASTPTPKRLIIQASADGWAKVTPSYGRLRIDIGGYSASRPAPLPESEVEASLQRVVAILSEKRVPQKDVTVYPASYPCMGSGGDSWRTCYPYRYVDVVLRNLARAGEVLAALSEIPYVKWDKVYLDVEDRKPFIDAAGKNAVWLAKKDAARTALARGCTESEVARAEQQEVISIVAGKEPDIYFQTGAEEAPITYRGRSYPAEILIVLVPRRVTFEVVCAGARD